MTSGVRLRPLRWWDVEPLLPLEAELFGPEAWSAETWWAELAQGGHRSYLLAEGADGGVLGYAGLSFAGADADVMTVAIAPSRQGHGLGRLLLQALLDHARARGTNAVLLEVRADNDPAKRLYTSLGFERIAVRRGYYRSADGPQDAWVMRLLLTSDG